MMRIFCMVPDERMIAGSRQAMDIIPLPFVRSSSTGILTTSGATRSRHGPCHAKQNGQAKQGSHLQRMNLNEPVTFSLFSERKSAVVREPGDNPDHDLSAQGASRRPSLSVLAR